MRNPDTWKITVEVDRADADTAAFVLSELGSMGSAEEQTDSDATVRIHAYFDKDRYDPHALRDDAVNAFSAFPSLANAWIEVELEPARDWNERWMELFKPFAIAKGFVIVPSWERYEPRSGERIMHLDPGMAFGTGLHETTRVCANALLEHLPKMKDTLSVLDVGTGSGILAIMARMLGAGRIAAVDNDPDAVAVARENFEKNGCEGILTDEDLASIPGQFDVVIANILLPTLLFLEELIAARTKAGGVLILSGITYEQEGEILESYAKHFVLLSTERLGEWSALVLRRKAAR